jgi:hypothetical protein
MNLLTLVRKTRRKIIQVINPLKYARLVGVNFPVGGHIFTVKFHGGVNLGLLH